MSTARASKPAPISNHDRQQLEDADDDAKGPMQNAWVTNAGATASQALKQEVGEVHALSIREKPKSAAGPPPAQRPFSRYRDSDDVAPSIVVPHEHTNIVGPNMSGVAHHSSSCADSATMTAPDLTAASTPHPDPSRPRGSQVLGESALPPVSEVPERWCLRLATTSTTR